MTKEGFEIWIDLPLPLKSMPPQPTLVFSCRPDLKYNTVPFDYYFLINYMSMGINSSKSVQLNRGMSWNVSFYPSSLPGNMLGKVYTMF